MFFAEYVRFLALNIKTLFWLLWLDWRQCPDDHQESLGAPHVLFVEIRPFPHGLS